jgi:uncharacterized membrane protein
MANKNRNLIISYFPNKAEAEQKSEALREWDKERGDVKLGGMGIITLDENGKLKTQKVGARAGGTGAKWGTILGATAGILSGGVTLIGGAVVGLAAGAVAGALFHKKLGMEDEDKERLVQHLQDGGAALAVMVDDDEIDPTKFQLLSMGGSVENYLVPDETMDELDEAADAADVEETDEAELLTEGERMEEVKETAVIHYHRPNSDYDWWGLHVWSGYDGEVSWEQPLPPAGFDHFGIYFEVPVAEDAPGLGYIIHRGDEKDLWEDQYLDFAEHGREVWIMQNSPGYVDPPASAEEEE